MAAILCLTEDTHKCFSIKPTMSTTETIPPRFQPILSLANETFPSGHTKKVIEEEIAAERLSKEHGVVPTIGCEVEVSWASLYPELIDKYFSELDPQKTFTTMGQMAGALTKERREEFLKEKEAIEKQEKAKYEATVQMGIPKGNDGYWEFAHSPAYAWQTVAEEVDILMDRGLIPTGFPHAMHITLGGIAIEGGGPHLMLAGFELLTVPSERIRKAANASSSYSWARRESHNVGGLRHRPAHKLMLGQQSGVEFRTLVTSKPEDHRASLRIAQLLGTILLCKRNQANLQSEALAKIAELWPSYRSAITSLFEARNLPNTAWDNPSSSPPVWRTWADCLDRRDMPETPEHMAVEKINKLLNKTEALLIQV